MAVIGKLQLQKQAPTHPDAERQEPDLVLPEDPALVACEFLRRAINATLDGDWQHALQCLAQARGLLHGARHSEVVRA